MAVDLFSLRMNLQTTGEAQAVAGLRTVEAAGARTAATMGGLTAAGNQVKLGYFAQASASAVLAAQQENLRNSIFRVGRDVNAATADFKAGRISVMDLAAAKGFARGEALKLGTAANLSKDQLKEFNRVIAETAPLTLKAGSASLMFKDMMKSGLVQFLGVTAAMGLVKSGYNTVTDASDQLVRSQQMLAGVAQITGVPLATLQRVAANLERDFRLSTVQANQLTAGMNKLTQMAGQPEKLERSIGALLDIGSARGLSAVQTLSAINNALAGNDEGTDKLFMKNPSEIYRKWAASAGLVATELDASQRAQALLDQVITDGATTRGAYLRWMETTPGKLEVLDNATTQFSAHLGSMFSGIRGMLASAGLPLISWLDDIIQRMGRLGGSNTPLGIAVKLGLALGGQGKAGDTNWDANDLGPTKGAGQRGRGQGIVSLPPTAVITPADAAEIDRLAAKAAAAHVKKMLKVLDISAPGTLPGGGLMSTPSMFGSAAGDIAGLSDDNTIDRGKRDPLDVWAQSLNQSAQGVKDNMRMLGTDLGMTLANGFSSAMSAAVQGKNPFKAFGQAILGGLGSIFTRMGAELIAYGVIMLNLLPFLSNPFTSGFAAIAAGAALVAAGTVLGGIATGGSGGGGKGGGSAPKDITTTITLTPDGAGGFKAPAAKGGDTFNIFGAHDPQVHRQLAETVKNAKRSGHRF